MLFVGQEEMRSKVQIDEYLIGILESLERHARGFPAEGGRGKPPPTAGPPPPNPTELCPRGMGDEIGGGGAAEQMPYIL